MRLDCVECPVALLCAPECVTAAAAAEGTWLRLESVEQLGCTGSCGKEPQVGACSVLGAAKFNLSSRLTFALRGMALRQFEFSGNCAAIISSHAANEKTSRQMNCRVGRTRGSLDDKDGPFLPKHSAAAAHSHT